MTKKLFKTRTDVALVRNKLDKMALDPGRANPGQTGSAMVIVDVTGLSDEDVRELTHYDTGKSFPGNPNMTEEQMERAIQDTMASQVYQGTSMRNALNPPASLSPEQYEALMNGPVITQPVKVEPKKTGIIPTFDQQVEVLKILKAVYAALGIDTNVSEEQLGEATQLMLAGTNPVASAKGALTNALQAAKGGPQRQADIGEMIRRYLDAKVTVAVDAATPHLPKNKVDARAFEEVNAIAEEIKARRAQMSGPFLPEEPSDLEEKIQEEAWEEWATRQTQKRADKLRKKNEAAAVLAERINPRARSTQTAFDRERDYDMRQLAERRDKEAMRKFVQGSQTIIAHSSPDPHEGDEAGFDMVKMMEEAFSEPPT